MRLGQRDNSYNFDSDPSGAVRSQGCLSQAHLGYGLLAGQILLTPALIAAPPSASAQCGYLLFTAFACWHFRKPISHLIILSACAVLLISAWVHDMPREAYLLAPMTLAAGVGVSRARSGFNDAEKAANVDKLTGALTPRGFEKMLRTELAKAKSDDRTTALIFLDLDHFKSINDRYGHSGGDEVLRHVVTALRSVLREKDHVARIGGDEFLVFLQVANDPARPESVQSSLVGAIETLPWGVSTSAGGIVIPPDNYPDPGSLIRLADNLMYDVKRSGRGRLDMQHLPTTDPGCLSAASPQLN